MLQTLKNAWKTKDLRSKILFTIFILLVYRIGTVIPVPFVDAHSFSAGLDGTILQQIDVFSGGAFGTATLFALGVTPYINASIIIQLLTVVFPKLGDIAKNDKEKMNVITKVTTLILALVTAIGYYFMLRNAGALTANALNSNITWLYAIVIIACFCAGAAIVMWLGDRINERGIGNGISMILFANIIAQLPTFFYSLVAKVIIPTFGIEADNELLYIIGSIVFALVVTAILIGPFIFVIFVTGSERRIPIQYAKRVVGRKMYGGQSSNLPIKLNMTGVMPVIFASSIVGLLPTILSFCGINESSEGFWGGVCRFFSASGVVYPILFFILIVAFSYFYTQISFDPVEVSNNIKRQGGTIPGIRQGRPTAMYIKKILGKVTLAGALFLSIVAILPIVLGPHVFTPIIERILTASNQELINEWQAMQDPSSIYYQIYGEANIGQLANQMFTGSADTTPMDAISSQASSLASVFTFGGTSILIIVGVVLETFRELEAQLTMRNYKGFL
ncbi:MAG: preprotein translocase subunit SecY [Clostridia bacterium]|nr:preprotein translocase subunit SecY [Clostridia bacterium]